MGVQTLTDRERQRSIYQARDLERWSMCEKKRKYETRAQASAGGQRFYLCPHCKYYHRTTKELRARNAKG